LVGVSVFLGIFSAIVFFAPEMGGYFLEANNFIPADPMKTPPHIAPVWYFTPFYAILRAIPQKQLGVIAMGAAVLIFLALPWLDRGLVKSIRYRGTLYKTPFGLFITAFLILGYMGTQDPNLWYVNPTSQICTVIYFSFFLLMPIYTRLDKSRPAPERVTS